MEAPEAFTMQKKVDMTDFFNPKGTTYLLTPYCMSNFFHNYI